MDILNFISWLRSRRIVKKAPANALVPLGLRDNRRGDRYLSVGIKVEDLLADATGGGGATEYKQALLPSKSTNPQTASYENNVGEAISVGGDPSGYTYVKLENGNLARVEYCQSVLPNGILIYEAYELNSLALIYGYWIAFKQNENDPKLLEKVGECQMTEQFWDNWYNWTVKDSGDNVVKLVTANYPNFNTTVISSKITTLTYSNGTLTAVDSGFDFNNEDTLSLYESLSGQTLDPDLTIWNFAQPEWILDDDYYGMAMGTEAGWYYYRDQSGQLGPGTQWNCVGFNILTGETRWVTPVADIFANVTNFDFTGIDPNNMIQYWYNHPNGIMFTFSNFYIVDNGNNVNGVTCIWSPYFDNPNQVIYLTSRDPFSGIYLFQYGDMSLGNPSGWYWDNKNIYVWIANTLGSVNQSIIVERYNTDTKEKTSWNIPSFYNGNLNAIFMYSWANNNGMMFYINDLSINFAFGLYDYYYFNSDPYYLKVQSNNWYPTHMFDNKTYSTYSALFRNTYSVGFELDEYTNVEF